MDAVESALLHAADVADEYLAAKTAMRSAIAEARSLDASWAEIRRYTGIEHPQLLLPQCNPANARGGRTLDPLPLLQRAGPSGATNRELAERIGVSTNTVSKWRLHQRRISMRNADRYAASLGLTFDEIWEDWS